MDSKKKLFTMINFVAKIIHNVCIFYLFFDLVFDLVFNLIFDLIFNRALDLDLYLDLDLVIDLSFANDFDSLFEIFVSCINFVNKNKKNLYS